MDVTSPFFVVPVLAIVFLSCIGFAALTGKDRFDETVPDESDPRPGTH